MESTEARSRLDEVERIMRRTSLNTRLPGRPAIIAGGIVLAACAVSYFLLNRSLDFAKLYDVGSRTQWAFCLMWAAVAIVALGQEILLTRWAAKKAGGTTRPGRLAAMSLTPSIAVAVLLSLRILLGAHDEAYGGRILRLLPPIWMMCYGTGVYAAGLFSVRLPRMLGVAFILIGAVALVPRLDRYGLLLIAASFGLLHILFGLLVLRGSAATETETDEAP